MASWFVRGLRRGIATTRYPKTVDAWATQLPSPPSFHSRRLTVSLADELIGACGAGALSRTGQVLLVDLGRCTSCGRCLEVGRGVVEPSGEFLLASADRDVLIKRVPIEGGER